MSSNPMKSKGSGKGYGRGQNARAFHNVKLTPVFWGGLGKNGGGCAPLVQMPMRQGFRAIFGRRRGEGWKTACFALPPCVVGGTAGRGGQTHCELLEREGRLEARYTHAIYLGIVGDTPPPSPDWSKTAGKPCAAMVSRWGGYGVTPPPFCAGVSHE